MLRQGEGHIVNFSSVFGFVTVPTQSAYHVSKFGIRGFTECLSRELAGTDVCATCVHPGGIATNIGAGARFGVERRRDRAAVHGQRCRELLRTSPDDCARDDPRTASPGASGGSSSATAREPARRGCRGCCPPRYGAVLHRLRGV